MQNSPARSTRGSSERAPREKGRHDDGRAPWSCVRHSSKSQGRWTKVRRASAPAVEHHQRASLRWHLQQRALAPWRARRLAALTAALRTLRPPFAAIRIVHTLSCCAPFAASSCRTATVVVVVVAAAATATAAHVAAQLATVRGPPVGVTIHDARPAAVRRVVVGAVVVHVRYVARAAACAPRATAPPLWSL